MIDSLSAFKLYGFACILIEMNSRVLKLNINIAKKIVKSTKICKKNAKLELYEYVSIVSIQNDINDAKEVRFFQKYLI